MCSNTDLFAYGALLKEPHHEKTGFCLCKSEGAGQQCAVCVQLFSAFVFDTRIVQVLFFLNPKIQASSYLLRLYTSPKPAFSRSNDVPIIVFESSD